MTNSAVIDAAVSIGKSAPTIWQVALRLLRAGLSHNRSPFLVFRSDMTSELRRAERHRDGAEAAGALQHAWIFQRRDNRAVKLGDDLRRCATRRDEAEPSD
jgi:hypothetical protein